MALAIDGGAPVRTAPFPARHIFGPEETEVVNKLFQQADETGGAIGYNGPEEQAYEAEFAEYMGGGYCDMVNSGTSAVYVALGALQLPVRPNTTTTTPPHPLLPSPPPLFRGYHYRYVSRGGAGGLRGDLPAADGRGRDDAGGAADVRAGRRGRGAQLLQRRCRGDRGAHHAAHLRHPHRPHRRR